MNTKKLKIAVLFSGSASSVRYLIDNDPNYGVTYEFVYGVSNKNNTKGIDFLKEKNIPCEVFNTKEFCIHNGHNGKLSEMPDWVRRRYFTSLRARLNNMAKDIDLILLSGFMLEIVPPLLGHRPIINVHPADLSIQENAKPKYTGDNAVALAINSGEKSTASTIHVVEEVVDHGRIICISEHLPIGQNISIKDHQEKMKFACDGPAYQKAIEMIVSGEFKF